MRILHVINGLGTGGAEMLVVNLAAAMRGHGHDVTIACLADVDGVPNGRARDLTLDVRILSPHRLDPRLPLRVAALAKGYDIIHAHLFPSLYWTALAPTTVPKVLTEHSTSNRRAHKSWLQPVDRWIYRRFDRVFAISQGAAEHLATTQRHPAEAFPVVLNGIDGELLKHSAARRPGEQRIISVSSLDNRRKDLLRAVEVLVHLPAATLTIVGDGPDRPAIESHATSRGVSDRLTLAGQRSDVADYLRRHDVFLSSSRIEGFGIAAVEAMAAGLPVVAPDIPGIREVVTHERTGLLYDRGDDAEPTRSLTRLFHDVPLADGLATAARADAARFTIDSCAAKYEQHYADITGQVMSRRAESSQ
ncbi:glycosyltransferase [Tessaracoccus sp. Z1128]